MNSRMVNLEMMSSPYINDNDDNSSTINKITNNKQLIRYNSL